MNAILLFVFAYVIGATPTSYWVGKVFFGVDLRSRGSGNLGATNTFRVLGWKAAVPVAVFDVFKGWFPVWFFPQVDDPAVWAWTLGYAAAAILGHVFSFWVGLKGGKGIATSAGAFLALAPWAVLVALAVWIVVVFSTRIVSLGSLGAAVALPVSLLFLPHAGGSALVGFTLALSAFVFWAHRSNIRRLLGGDENRFGGRARTPGAPSGIESAGTSVAPRGNERARMSKEPPTGNGEATP